MSIKSAKDFVEKMRTDDKFAQKIAEAKSWEQRSQIVKADGYKFSKHEFDTVVSELSDSQLDGVVGGTAANNKFFSIGMKSLTGSGTSGFKCDSSGSEGECVC
ncbi:MAG: Nif11-like leader peptide family natural product precursor [Candidatus Riflebacteria bacterium]|nr:Nif11-like leader peptide family natural product precursor [Candidatus Riflebacteria bacterium]